MKLNQRFVLTLTLTACSILLFGLFNFSSESPDDFRKTGDTLEPRYFIIKDRHQNSSWRESQAGRSMEGHPVTTAVFAVDPETRASRILYNRVGCCGSSMVGSVIRTLAQKNKFLWISTPQFGTKILPPSEQVSKRWESRHIC